MNTGQMMLALGAMILLSTTVLRVNNNFLISDTVLDETKYNFLATSIATSIIQEAKNKAFDQATDSISIDDTKFLTEAKYLGKESGEVYDNFNDFDDYHDYSGIDASMPSAVFSYKCIVTYIDENNPNVTPGNKTWNKMLTVTVTSPFMADEITVSTIYSYWFFR
jgi:MSHA pilin protein MshD